MVVATFENISCSQNCKLYVFLGALVLLRFTIKSMTQKLHLGLRAVTSLRYTLALVWSTTLKQNKTKLQVETEKPHRIHFNVRWWKSCSWQGKFSDRWVIEKDHSCLPFLLFLPGCLSNHLSLNLCLTFKRLILMKYLVPESYPAKQRFIVYFKRCHEYINYRTIIQTKQRVAKKNH